MKSSVRTARRHSRLTRLANLFLFKKIAVDVLYNVGVGGGDADVVLNHQVGQTITVYQDDFLGHFFGVGDGRVREIAGGNKNTLVGLLAGQCAD
jgi:hypothetical protein